MANDEIIKVIRIQAEGSETTVKSLKKQIEDLRDALLNTEKGSDEYKKVLDSLIDSQKKLADVMSAGKKETENAAGSYNALKNEMSALKKVWAEVTDTASRDEIGKRINEINTELKEMDASIGNFQRNVGNYASGFKNARQELAALKTQMDNLEEGTAEYNAAFQRAAEITHNLQERQQMLQYSAADLGTQLSNIASIGSSLAAGFNSINAIIALTGDKSEELQKTMMKLQAGIALVQGLQGLEGMTKRMKGLVDGLTGMIFKTKETVVAVNEETTAVAGNTAAQEANVVATNAATVATKGFQKALVATGIGAIVVLLGSLVAHWEDLKDVIGLSDEKLQKFNEALDRVRVIAAGVASALTQYILMPIKNVIYALETTGKVMKDVFTLKFGDIAKDIKEGFGKIVDTTKNGFSVISNFREGAAKQQSKITEKRLKEELAASAEELNETIKDNEAKYGSDWKYTEDGKKLYDAYFKKKLSLYKEDSKEYRELMRQKWAYDREYEEKKKKAGESGKSSTGLTDAQKQAQKDLENIEKIEKRAKDAAKTELELLEDKYNEEKALYEEYEKDTTALTAEYEAKKAKIIADNAKKAQDEADKKIAEATRKALKMSDRRLQTSEDTNEQNTRKIELEYSLKEAKQSGTLSFDDIIEQTNKIYEENKRHLESQAAEYKALMENADIDDEARLNAKRDYYNTLTEMDNLATENIIDNIKLQREAVDEQIKMYQDLANSISSIFGSIADILQQDIQNKIKNGKITEEEGEKQFKAVKAFQIAQATINTISGAISAFMQAQGTYPPPMGQIIGGVAAAAVTAAGVAQIAKIKSTQLGSNSSISSNMGASAVQPQPEQYQPQMYQNPTGESEITKLADSMKAQRVFVVESDITEAQAKSKRVKVESTW